MYGLAMPSIRPMVTNPGGVVEPDDLVGRDRELNRLLKSVNTGGAKLLGDRRMGKTSLLNKAADQLEAVGHEVIRISVESSDPELFSQRLLSRLATSRVLGQHLTRWTAELGGELRLDVGPAGFLLKGNANRGAGPEVDFFDACLDATTRLKPYRLVFFFDEITVLASKLGARLPGGPEQLLHMLRAPRQHVHGVSMVMAGSVGLHHVLTDRSPLNDLDGIRIGPLADVDALYLARCLLLGAGVHCSDDVRVGQAVVEQTCAIPYYIHQLVGELAVRNFRLVTEQDVARVVDDALHDDLWGMKHYLHRVPKYYGAEADAVVLMLDEYAAAPEPLTVEDVLNRLAVHPELQLTRDKVLNLVMRLEDDHYLVRVGRADRFATSLLLRAWRELRRS
jgi:AAA ATPase domain